ncbi:hypothetical protein MVES1_000644 [Malassezia vespertilionis]|uniref:uncharacterized protein n=1 Tax=Malassezia vespertilionis TaxID=2020962 RepID=UPI0024B0977B|nr:uncharacterized protein MVES1_000644 [Malassezia vespertilionis]WFD05314.1 hypothetical protein MVES1_000644 [Malassezia vespertilionis]
MADTAHTADAAQLHGSQPPSAQFATPTIPVSTDAIQGDAPRPPADNPSSLFTHASHPNITRSASLLISKSLIEQSPMQAAGALITLLSNSSPVDPLVLHPTTPDERLTVVQLMRRFGTPAYFTSFAQDIRGRAILAAWLSDATPPRKAEVEDQSERFKDVLVPVLELLQVLPIQLEHLKDHIGLGKLITGTQKRARSEQARSLADAIKDKWSALVSVRPSPPAPQRAATPPTSTKRVAASAPTTDTAKRPKSTSAQAARPPNTLLSSSTNARASAATERRSSPQIHDVPAKAPVARTTAALEPKRNTRTAAKTNNNASKDLASFMSLIDQPQAPMSHAKPEASAHAQVQRKRKKAVHWKDHDGMALVSIKLIEPAVYDDEMYHGAKGVGALDMEEGGAFRQAHAEMDEQIDWYTPVEPYLPDPPSGPLPERGSESDTKEAQEEREHAVEEAVYPTAAAIPPTPEEPEEIVLSFASMAPPPASMTTGTEIAPFPARSTSPLPATETMVPPVPPPEFMAMMAQMAAMQGGPDMPPWIAAGGPPMPPFDPSMMQSFMQAMPGPDMPMPMPMGGAMPGFPFPMPPPEMMAQMGMPFPEHAEENGRGAR